MTKRGWMTLALVAALVAVSSPLWWSSEKAPEETVVVAPESPLFTGEEKKGSATLYFVNSDKGNFGKQSVEIYLTESYTAQLKQILMAFFAGPTEDGLVAVFPEGSAAREVFLDGQGLAVIDLNSRASKAHPGGTSAEFQSLYALYKTVVVNFPKVQRVQVLVEGKRVDSLAGHLDLMDPLTKNYF